MTPEPLDLSGVPDEVSDALRELVAHVRERFGGPPTPYDAEDFADAARRVRAAVPPPAHPSRFKTVEERIAARRAFIARHAVHGLNLDLSREGMEGPDE